MSNEGKAPIIEMRPRGKWRLTCNGASSPLADYSERIVWGSFVAQTEYWGEEKVWVIHGLVKHRSVDLSLEEVKTGNA